MPRYTPHSADKRIYGTARWRALRKAVFERDGMTCQACGSLCIGTGRDDPLSPECDHIQPHRGDPALMWDMGNLQTLHKRCHSIKTIVEDGGMIGGASSHPDWLPSPACPVTVVCGPAGAGKTTWAKAQARPRDTVIDLDDCFTAVCGEHGHTAGRQHLQAALRLRNRMLANLASQRQGRAYFIVSAPTHAERQWWASKLGADVQVIRASMDEIASRGVGDRRIALAREWFDAELHGQWTPPGVRAVGLDGYPE